MISIYNCSQCSAGFDKISEAREHVITHSNAQVIETSVRCAVFAQKTLGAYKCGYCRSRQMDAERMAQHMTSKHRMFSVTSDDLVFEVEGGSLLCSVKGVRCLQFQ
ncbi:MAG: hypothetical protein S4CHLAM81_03130 [Chlamydiales bacterium]|nr:hypothetical protein [Chlamydiales bacterium]MCH9635103.1 hypothetical protein [Chlamydiales bacterium]